MTKTELLLLEKIIENAVSKAVNEALEKSVKKDLKEIKLLTAKIIKEGMVSAAAGTEKPLFNPIKKTPVSLNSALNESSEYKTISRTSQDVAPQPMYNAKLPSSMADHYANSDTIPENIDAPIFINPNSLIMQEIRDKYINS